MAVRTFKFDLKTVWLLREATAFAARDGMKTKADRRRLAELSEHIFLRAAIDPAVNEQTQFEFYIISRSKKKTAKKPKKISERELVEMGLANNATAEILQKYFKYPQEKKPPPRKRRKFVRDLNGKVLYEPMPWEYSP